MRLLVLLAGVVFATTPVGATEVKVSDKSGKTIAVILDCNSCKDEAKGRDCSSGVTDGFHRGERCGQCLLDANFGAKLLYSSDVQINGKLKDRGGKAVADEFVRLYLPNTWTVRTRTAKDGLFRLLLGATQERQGDSIQVRLGDRTRDVSGDSERPDYALYMLPESYKPCKDSK
jgi:hypothetical protein